MQWFAEFLSNTIAIILIATGVLKVVSSGEFPDSSFAFMFSFQAVLFVVGMSELVLGFWLLSRISDWWSPRVCLLFFIGTLIYGVVGLLQGKETCPCFGNFHSPTLLGVVLSGFGIIALSFVVRASVIREKSVAATNQWLLGGIGLSLVVIGSTELLMPTFRFIDYLGALDGRCLSVETRDIVVNVDYVSGSTQTLPIRLRNNCRSKPLSVVGIRSWGCPMNGHFTKLPISLAPGESKTVDLCFQRAPAPSEMIELLENAPDLIQISNHEYRLFTERQTVTYEIVTGDLERSNQPLPVVVIPTGKFLAKIAAVRPDK